MASTMASTLALSRPSEKLGTHSTSVDIGQKNSWAGGTEARRTSRLNCHPKRSRTESLPLPILIPALRNLTFALAFRRTKNRIAKFGARFVHGRRDQDAPCGSSCGCYG